MNHNVPKTLAYYQSNPQFGLMSMAHHALPVVTGPAKLYKDATDSHTIKPGQPDQDALWFYSMNQCAAIVRKKFTPNEILPDWADQVMQKYTQVVAEQVQRMATYMLLIVTREARHSGNAGDFKAEFSKTYGKSASEFYKKIQGNGEMQAIGSLLVEPPSGVSIEQYLQMISHIFHKGSWGGSYGGPPWGNITDTLLQAIQGKISFEMMVDTGYTLAHNGGPMFNKNMMYQMYTSNFMRILDVQRSGQVCELLLDKPYEIPQDQAIASIVSTVKEACPDEFGKYMDWFKVVPVNDSGYLIGMKQLQKQYHPKSVPANEEGLVVKKAKKNPLVAAPKLAPVDMKNVFVIHNNEYALKVEREKLGVPA